MEKYEPNSHKSKEKREVPKEKIAGDIKIKKRFFDMVIQEDIGNVGSYILTDVVVPALKRLLVDAVNRSTNRLVYGPGGDRRSDTGGSKVSYRRYYDEPYIRDDRFTYEVPKKTDYRDVIFSSREQVEDVINYLFKYLDTYDYVRVADLNEYLGISGDYTDNYYGWQDISTAAAIETSDGYMLKLPKKMPLPKNIAK